MVTRRSCTQDNVRVCMIFDFYLALSQNNNRFANVPDKNEEANSHFHNYGKTGMSLFSFDVCTAHCV